LHHQTWGLTSLLAIALGQLSKDFADYKAQKLKRKSKFYFRGLGVGEETC
jgi:hypothetical protein